MGVPHHTSTAITVFAAVHAASPVVTRFLTLHTRLYHVTGSHGSLYRRSHRMKLMIAGDDFMELASVGVLLKYHEMLQRVEKAARVKHAMDQHLKL